jgi:c-di-GMP-binding flagellar brake protein YcgR
MATGEERRKQIRIFLPGGQVRLSSGPLLILIGKIVNISAKGAQLTCDCDLKSGDSVSIDITIPDGIRIQAQATIIYGQRSKDTKFVYGIEFSNMDEAHKKVLGDYILKSRATQDSLLRDELEKEN